MRIKIDENPPTELRDLFAGTDRVVDTVHDEGLQGQSDSSIWHAAQADARFLVTQDLDFPYARRYRPGAHSGILIIRLREPTRRRLIQRVSSVLQRNDIRDWQGCLVVLSESRLRVRRPVA